jgi:hypothetical protein
MNNHIDPVMTESHNAPVNDDIGDHFVLNMTSELLVYNIKPLTIMPQTNDVVVSMQTMPVIQ